jgi:hypothetical protein
MGKPPEQVAAALGMPPVLFDRVDAGRQALPIDVAEGIARVLGVSLADILSSGVRVTAIRGSLPLKVNPPRPDLGDAFPYVSLATPKDFVLPPRAESPPPVFMDRVWFSTYIPENGISRGFIGCIDCSTRTLVGMHTTGVGSNVTALAWNGAGYVWGVDGIFWGGGKVWQSLTSNPSAAPVKVMDGFFGPSRAVCNAGDAGMFKGNLLFADEPVSQVQAFDGVTGAPGVTNNDFFSMVQDIIEFDGLLYVRVAVSLVEFDRIVEFDPSTMTIQRVSTGFDMKLPGRLAVAFDHSVGSFAIFGPVGVSLAFAPVSSFVLGFKPIDEMANPIWGEGICADPEGNLWLGVNDGAIYGIGRFNLSSNSIDMVLTDFGADEVIYYTGGNAFVTAINDGAVWAMLVLENQNTENKRVVAVRIDLDTLAITDILTLRNFVSSSEFVSHATMEVIS